MFRQSNEIAPSIAPGAYGHSVNAGQAPSPIGIATRADELRKSAGSLSEAVNLLQNALGMGNEQSAKEPAPPQTLSDLLNDVRIIINRAEDSVRNVTQHLNS